MATQYRVRGILNNNLVVNHNLVTPPGTFARPLLQVMYGGAAGQSGAGITPSKMCVDSQGNIIIVGLSYYTVNFGSGTVPNYGGQDFVIAKYAPSGICIWAEHYGYVSDDLSLGVCVDSHDNIYAIGTVSTGPFPATLNFGFGPEQAYGSTDVILIKLKPDAGVLWHKIFGTNGADAGGGVAVDSNDDVYITGTHGAFSTNGGINFGGGALPNLGRPSMFLAKLSGTDGSYIWAKSYGAASNPVYGVSITIASDGNVLIGSRYLASTNYGLGLLTTTSPTENSALVKFNSSTGATIWQSPISGTHTVSLYQIATTASGIIYVGGDFLYDATLGGHSLTSAAGGSFFIFKVGPNGAWLAGTQWGAESNGPHLAGIAATDSLGPVIAGEMITGIAFGVNGGTLSGGGGNDIMLVRFNPDLTVNWARRGAAEHSGGGDRASAVTIFGGNIYLAGDCGTNFGLAGFERNTGFGQSTVDRALTLVTGDINGATTQGNSHWVKFSP